MSARTDDPPAAGGDVTRRLPPARLGEGAVPLPEPSAARGQGSTPDPAQVHVLRCGGCRVEQVLEHVPDDAAGHLPAFLAAHAGCPCPTEADEAAADEQVRFVHLDRRERGGVPAPRGGS